MMKINTKNKKIKLLAILLVAALAGLAFTLYTVKNKTTKYDPSDGVNYNPPTEEEELAGDRQKTIIDEEENRRDVPTDKEALKKKTTVIITDAGQYDDIIEVRSFVPDHFENGSCTITLQKDSSIIEKNTPAYKDISSTICTNPLIKRSELADSGEWIVTVSYESESAKGISDPQVMHVR